MATASLNVQRELHLPMLRRASAQNSELCQCSSSISILVYVEVSLKVVRIVFKNLTSMLNKDKTFQGAYLEILFPSSMSRSTRSMRCIFKIECYPFIFYSISVDLLFNVKLCVETHTVVLSQSLFSRDHPKHL